MPHIDYFSFTFPPAPEVFEIAVNEYAERAVLLLARELGGEWCDYYLVSKEFSVVSPMRPYAHAARHDRTGIEVHYHQALMHAYIRIPGGACRMLDMDGKGLKGIIEARASSATRIDIANDFATKLRPEEVRDAGFSRRISSISLIKSGVGETFYLGSRQSEKFTRVYRYDPPHIRADFLRVEMEFKRDKAKAVAAALGAGVDDVYWSEFSLLQLGHPELQRMRTSGRLVEPAPRATRGQAGREKWVKEIALPSIRRAIIEGIVDKNVVLEYIEHTYGDVPF